MILLATVFASVTLAAVAALAALFVARAVVLLGCILACLIFGPE